MTYLERNRNFTTKTSLFGKESVLHMLERRYRGEVPQLYDDSFQFKKSKPKTRTLVELVNESSMECLSNLYWYEDFSTIGKKEKICVLDFADYCNPCGEFFHGGKAQEEELCYFSALPVILPMLCGESDNSKDISNFYNYNSHHRNNGLFENRAIFMDHVPFLFENYLIRSSNVIVCSAPDKNYQKNVRCYDPQKNSDALESRIEFVINIARQEKIKVLVLGAWGCGVYGQDPEEVCNLITKHSKFSGIKKVIIAIPDVKTFNAFRLLFDKKTVSKEEGIGYVIS